MTKITYFDFFTTYFPHVALVIADWTKQAITLETILEEHPESLGYTDFENLQLMNEHGYSVYFTPNAVKEIKKGIHSLDNFESVNACYIDIDIDETKQILTPEDLQKRNNRKEELAGIIWMAPLQPSFVVETRNGYQVYWFTSTDISTFKKIQKGILEYFKPFGGDPATIKEVQLMRVPGFLQHKADEVFKVKLRYELCAREHDGSFKYYSPFELLENFPSSPEELQTSKVFTPRVSHVFANTFDIFNHILKLPIIQVFETINGSSLVNGDVFTLGPERNGKIQIYQNNHPIPNWIDTNLNMIFSNNASGFCNIIHFCGWYGKDKKEIAEELKKLFPNTHTSGRA